MRSARKPQTVRATRQPDPTGRVDLLASKLLETAIVQSHDPYLQAAYRHLKPDVDMTLGRLLRKYNCAPVLRKLGLAPPKTGAGKAATS